MGDCIEALGSRDSWGYGRVAVGGKQLRAHRHAWMLHHGAIPAGMCVLHKCDNPACINIDHLFLGTQTDNMADKVAKGRQSKGKQHSELTKGKVPSGSKNHAARLTEDQVSQIRALAPTHTQRALAQQFGVGQATIWYVLKGITWKDVAE